MDENAQTPTDDTPDTDAEEWGAVNEAYAEDQGVTVEKEEEKPAEVPSEKPADKPEDKPAEDGGEEPSKEATPPDPTLKPAEEEEKPTEPAKPAEGAPEQPVEPEAPEKVEVPQDPKAVVREMEADRKAMQDEVREQLYGTEPTELTDADGDPIRTIQDVTRLMNPVTGQPFTEEQAAVWLMQAQSNFNKNLEARKQEVEKIADTQIQLRESADRIRAKYKKLFEQNPERQKEVWAQYLKTLKSKENLIIEAPVDIEKFYDTALSGDVALMEKEGSLAEAEKAKQAEIDAIKAEAEKAKEEAQKEVERVKTRADREDVISTGKTDTRSEEDKEWDKAAKDYYED